MNLFGASLIVVAGFYIGFLKASEIRRRVAVLRGVCTMTELIRNEISSRRTPMDELFSMLQKSGPKTTESFAASVCDRLKSLDESSFSELWNESVSENLSCLPQRCTTALCELGASLGRYDAELQSAAADRCLSLLCSELAAEEAKQKANEKMYIGLCGGLSLIAALVLV